MFVIGRIDSPSFNKQVGHFVHEVERVKALLTRGPERRQQTTSPPRPSFRPEFAGKRKAYRLGETVEAQARHGLVVAGIAEFLKERGVPHGNDANRDLYVLTKRGKLATLFEVKTAVDSTSIYTAVGQLMLNSKAETTDPRQVLVVPEHPKPRTGAALEALGIEVVTYRWKKGDKPVFMGLPQII